MARPVAYPTAHMAQLAASDPHASAFVSAHAGTGKTKLLIDRLLRLMLAGADPARILCLTYTKAAAAEMAIRLQTRLGSWVALPDAALDTELADLEVVAAEASRRAARALFARVLDLPGGMRIGTIHAFCQSLLKRFPLEARISPHFQLVDESDARAALEQAREAALARADPALLEALAGLASAEGFAVLVAALEGNRHRLSAALALPEAALLAAFRRAAGAPHGEEAAILADAVAWPDEAPLRQVLELAAARGSDTVRAKAAEMLDWLGMARDLRVEHWPEWVRHFLLDDGKPRGPSIFANKKLSGEHPHIIPACEAEQARIDAVQDSIRALRMARASAALLRLAAPILASYAQAKERRALLDYDDLIGRTAGLLKDSGAAWVLFKLDGGLDHLLLDEVQDTAAAQWLIADRLTGDFFAGSGAREDGRPTTGTVRTGTSRTGTRGGTSEAGEREDAGREDGGSTTGEFHTGMPQTAALARTMFAVGDRKQSIYSFQGADPAEFDRWRDVYGRRVTQAELAWRPVMLDVSFRSTTPVLRLVDAVIAALGPQGGVGQPGETPHTPHRARAPGRVELWPLTPRPEAAEHTPWTVPQANLAQVSAPQTLVNRLSAWLAEQVASGTRPGDILVLVRRRGDFDRALVRALKAVGVPVAGLDRMVLTDQPAVQDLIALCRALLLPQDDLTFAEMLVSPLGGLSDDALMQLAATRQGSLWEALRTRAAERPDWQAAAAFFAGLLRRVDYAPPYALLSEALGPLGGRARLFARLGPEAAEPVDELLAAALLYEAGHPPSLQGFLHWLCLSAAEVKREADAAGDSVRVMTVHGAKGLEAGLVILPDTTGLPPDERSLCWATDPGTGAELPLWQPHRDLRCAAIDQLREAGELARLREYNRLLYVALTRARDRLLICGWQAHHPKPGTWYEQVLLATRSLDAVASTFGAWPGDMLVLEANEPEPGAQAATSRASQASIADAGATATDRGETDWTQTSRAEPGWRAAFQADSGQTETIGQTETGRLTVGGVEAPGAQADSAQQLPHANPAARTDQAPPAPVPSWAGAAPDWRPAPLPPEPPMPRPLAPSRPEGVEFGPVPPARSPLAAAGRSGRFGRGVAMHAMLQHLPDLPPGDWAEAALHYASQPAHGLDDPQACASEALAILAAPGLAPLFAPGSRAEQPVCGVVGGRVVSGQVDRLAVTADRVLIADYKTNRAPPETADAVPVTYLRQMAAYRDVLAQLYPGREVACWLVWTDGPLVMPLPPALLDSHGAVSSAHRDA